jgi:hypothetical protein
MNFWQKLRRAGSVLMIVVGAVAIVAALVQSPTVSRSTTEQPIHSETPVTSGTTGL